MSYIVCVVVPEEYGLENKPRMKRFGLTESGRPECDDEVEVLCQFCSGPRTIKRGDLIFIEEVVNDSIVNLNSPAGFTEFIRNHHEKIIETLLSVMNPHTLLP